MQSIMPRIEELFSIALLSSVMTFVLGCGQDGADEGGAGAVGTRSDSGASAKAPADFQRRVRQLIDLERYDEALEVLSGSSHPELARFEKQANEERLARDQLLEACTVIDGRDLEAIHEVCREIKTTSRYHERGCCSGASERYGETLLVAALDFTETDGPEGARSALLALAEERTLPEVVRERARHLAAGLEIQQEQDAGVDNSDAGLPGHQSVKSHRREAPQGEPPDVREAFAARALYKARVALQQGNQAGCIGALNDAPRTDQVVSLLITCYARAGNLRSACGIARRNRHVGYASQFAKRRCR